MSLLDLSCHSGVLALSWSCMPVDPHPERSTESDERPAAAQRFERTMRRILSVPKAELVKREAAYQKSRPQKKTRAVRTR